MEIHRKKYVDDQVKAGRFPTKDQVVRRGLEDLKLRNTPARDPLLGIFSDEPELMDEVVEAAMRDRLGGCGGAQRHLRNAEARAAGVFYPSHPLLGSIMVN